MFYVEFKDRASLQHAYRNLSWMYDEDLFTQQGRPERQAIPGSLLQHTEIVNPFYSKYLFRSMRKVLADYSKEMILQVTNFLFLGPS